MARFDLSGATAIVTGGSRGIGPHIAAALAEHGARVALIARSRRELEAVARDARRAGHQAIAVAADVTSHEDRHAILERVQRELDRSTCSSTTLAVTLSVASTTSARTTSRRSFRST